MRSRRSLVFANCHWHEGADALGQERGRQVHRRRDPVEVDGGAVSRVPPSLYLALAQTEPEEKAERFQLMQQLGISELEAAFKVAEKIDHARGIMPLAYDELFS